MHLLDKWLLRNDEWGLTLLERPLHESVAKEKSGEISLIEAGNEANNKLLAGFPTKSSGISTIFTRHPTRAKVSKNLR